MNKQGSRLPALSIFGLSPSRFDRPLKTALLPDRCSLVKRAALVLALLLCLGAAGCHGSTAEGASSQTRSTMAVTTKMTTKAATATHTQATVDAAVTSSVDPLVWIPRSGTKYHRSQACSNMKSPTEVPLSEAVDRGFTPCKKCY